MPKQATFSDRLKEGLELRHITKADLARLSGIGKSSLTHYEKGDWEGKQDKVYKLAKALNVSEAWLMGFDVPPDRDQLPVNEKQPSVTEGLSEDEAMLIAAYRALPPDERQHVLSLLRSIAERGRTAPASAGE